MKRLILILLLISISSFLFAKRFNNKNKLFEPDTSVNEEAKPKEYYAIDFAGGVNFTDINGLDPIYEDKSINFPSWEISLSRGWNYGWKRFFNITFEYSRFQFKVRRDAEKVSQVLGGITFLPLVKERFSSGLNLSVGIGNTGGITTWNGKITFLAIYNLTNRLYLLGKLSYNHKFTGLSYTPYSYIFNLGIGYRTSELSEIIKNKLAIGTTGGTLFFIHEGQSSISELLFLSTGEEYRASYSDWGFYPFIEFNLKSKNSNFHTIGFNYKSRFGEESAFSGDIQRNLSLKDYNLYYKFDYPINKETLINKPKPFVLSVSTGCLFNYKNLKVSSHGRFFSLPITYSDFNRDINSYKGLIQFSPNIKKHFSFIYYELGLNLNLLGYIWGNYYFQFRKYQSSLPYPILLDEEIHTDNYQKFLFLNDLYKDKYFFHSIYLKMGIFLCEVPSQSKKLKI